MAGIMTETAVLILENNLQRKLDLPLRRGRFEQNACRPPGAWRQGCSSRVKDIGITITRSWRSKVGVIENIKHFRAELDVEIFRYSLDLIILEDREVQVCDSRPNHNIPSRIAAKIEALQRCRVHGSAQAWRSGIAIG